MSCRQQHVLKNRPITRKCRGGVLYCRGRPGWRRGMFRLVGCVGLAAAPARIAFQGSASSDMWPFRRKTKEIPPPPVPEVWDWDSALGMRLHAFVSEHGSALEEAARLAGPELTVSFEKVGSVTAELSRLPDGRIHFDWGSWMPHDPYMGKRNYDAPVYEVGGSTDLVIGTSRVEQGSRSLLFSLDDEGNTVLVWPTDLPPTETEALRMKMDPSFPKIPVGIGRRPEVYMYYWSARGES